MAGSSSSKGACSSTKLMLPALYHTMTSTKNAHNKIAPVVPVKNWEINLNMFLIVSSQLKAAS